jgi:beta-mannosidase
VDLSGVWRAHAAEGELAKHFFAPAFDDSAWFETVVPQHWRTTAELASSDGPVLYRRTFHARARPDSRRFLTLRGIWYYGDVWLDGEYLGDTEGYFAPHTFEVTAPLDARDEHVLALEVACPPQRDRTAKRTVTGLLGHWDAADPDWNPGGPWLPIEVHETGPVAFTRATATCVEASVERGRLQLGIGLDAAGTRDVRLHAVLRGPAGVLDTATRDLTLAAGTNAFEWTLAVDHPPRWWPRSLGEQPLCELELTVEAAGTVSDRRVVRTGFREIHQDEWVFSVNGERLFVKGANVVPTRPDLGQATVAEIRGDLQLALDAHLDFVRVLGHVAHPALYDVADELGLLVWQDLPLQWGYARGVRRAAVEQARAMVDLLTQHPSVFVWCAHNAPFAVERDSGRAPGRGAAVKETASRVLPTWTKEVLDRQVAHALHRRDPTRPVSRHSGVLPGPTDGGADSHIDAGWEHGTMHDLAPQLRRWPRLGRFVSRFGAAASVPTTADWLAPQRWRDLDWDALSRRHGYQPEAFERHAAPGDAKTFDEWRDGSQVYQAALVQLQVEDLRRLKYAPTGGFAHYFLVDMAPSISASVVDHARVPKRAYRALQRACRPVLPMLEPRRGLVHVVNDTRRPLPGATVTVSVDGRTTRFAGDVGVDSVTYVGTVDLADAVDVELMLEHPATGTVANRYPLVVLRVP